VEVSAILAVCGVTGEERERLLKLCKDQHTRSWFQQFGSRLPKQVRTLIDHENRATTITEFEALMMPGLLQTDAYARALISRYANVPDVEVEERVAARAARRTIFSRATRPTCRFFIHEFVLQLAAGSREVMSEQLHNLLLMSVRPYIRIQVVPASVGVHAGMAGAFTLLEAPEYQSVVYLEGETTGLFLEKRDEIAAYRNVLAELSAAALDEGESKELIATVAIDLYGDRGDQHDDG
jgi:Domain of unknown function (DUF5753)